MSAPGWYPDPGKSGKFRYWDGSNWSAALSATPNAAPPSSTSGLGAPPQQTGGQQADGQTAGQAGGHGQQTHGQQTGGHTAGQQAGLGQPRYVPGGANQPRGRGGAWWLIGLAAVVALVIVAVLGIRSITSSVGGDGGDTPGTSNQEVCPEQKIDPSAEAAPQPNDGRVHGGVLSYPRLGAPWGDVRPDTRVPFGRNVKSQSVNIEDNYQPGQSWIAQVLVGELMAGDGFFTPEQGSEIVVKCIVGSFYGDNTKVNREDQKNQQVTVDGQNAWLVESHLTFDIKGLKTKGELAIVLIVENPTGASASLYYASIPDTAPQLAQPARDLIGQLKIAR